MNIKSIPSKFSTINKVGGIIWADKGEKKNVETNDYYNSQKILLLQITILCFRVIIIFCELLFFFILYYNLCAR